MKSIALKSCVLSHIPNNFWNQLQKKVKEYLNYNRYDNQELFNIIENNTKEHINMEIEKYDWRIIIKNKMGENKIRNNSKLSAITEISEAEISLYFSGKRVPRAEYLARLSRALNLSDSEILELEALIFLSNISNSYLLVLMICEKIFLETPELPNDFCDFVYKNFRNQIK